MLAQLNSSVNNISIRDICIILTREEVTFADCNLIKLEKLPSENENVKEVFILKGPGNSDWSDKSLPGARFSERQLAIGAIRVSAETGIEIDILDEAHYGSMLKIISKIILVHNCYVKVFPKPGRKLYEKFRSDSI